ncbi:hypothetical protein SK128_007030, partial [Halocaridina rubra]
MMDKRYLTSDHSDREQPFPEPQNDNPSGAKNITVPTTCETQDLNLQDVNKGDTSLCDNDCEPLKSLRELHASSSLAAAEDILPDSGISASAFDATFPVNETLLMDIGDSILYNVSGSSGVNNTVSSVFDLLSLECDFELPTITQRTSGNQLDSALKDSCVDNRPVVQVSEALLDDISDSVLDYTGRTDLSENNGSPGDTETSQNTCVCEHGELLLDISQYKSNDQVSSDLLLMSKHVLDEDSATREFHEHCKYALDVIDICTKTQSTLVSENPQKVKQTIHSTLEVLRSPSQVNIEKTDGWNTGKPSEDSVGEQNVSPVHDHQPFSPAQTRPHLTLKQDCVFTGEDLSVSQQCKISSPLAEKGVAVCREEVNVTDNIELFMPPKSKITLSLLADCSYLSHIKRNLIFRTNDDESDESDKQTASLHTDSMKNRSDIDQENLVADEQKEVFSSGTCNSSHHPAVSDQENQFAVSDEDRRSLQQDKDLSVTHDQEHHSVMKELENQPNHSQELQFIPTNEECQEIKSEVSNISNSFEVTGQEYQGVMNDQDKADFQSLLNDQDPYSVPSDHDRCLLSRIQTNQEARNDAESNPILLDPVQLLSITDCPEFIPEADHDEVINKLGFDKASLGLCTVDNPVELQVDEEKANHSSSLKTSSLCASDIIKAPPITELQESRNPKEVVCSVSNEEGIDTRRNENISVSCTENVSNLKDMMTKNCERLNTAGAAIYFVNNEAVKEILNIQGSRGASLLALDNVKNLEVQEGMICDETLLSSESEGLPSWLNTRLLQSVPLELKKEAESQYYSLYSECLPSVSNSEVQEGGTELESPLFSCESEYPPSSNDNEALQYITAEVCDEALLSPEIPDSEYQSSSKDNNAVQCISAEVCDEGTSPSPEKHDSETQFYSCENEYQSSSKDNETLQYKSAQLCDEEMLLSSEKYDSESQFYFCESECRFSSKDNNAVQYISAEVCDEVTSPSLEKHDSESQFYSCESEYQASSKDNETVQYKSVQICNEEMLPLSEKYDSESRYFSCDSVSQASLKDTGAVPNVFSGENKVEESTYEPCDLKPRLVVPVPSSEEYQELPVEQKSVTPVEPFTSEVQRKSPSTAEEIPPSSLKYEEVSQKAHIENHDSASQFFSRDSVCQASLKDTGAVPKLFLDEEKVGESTYESCIGTCNLSSMLVVPVSSQEENQMPGEEKSASPVEVFTPEIPSQSPAQVDGLDSGRAKEQSLTKEELPLCHSVIFLDMSEYDPASHQEKNLTALESEEQQLITEEELPAFIGEIYSGIGEGYFSHENTDKMPVKEQEGIGSCDGDAVPISLSSDDDLQAATDDVASLVCSDTDEEAHDVVDHVFYSCDAKTCGFVRASILAEKLSDTLAELQP